MTDAGIKPVTAKKSDSSDTWQKHRPNYLFISAENRIIYIRNSTVTNDIIRVYL